MNRSICDKNIRKAVYLAYKGKCFYTGRPVAQEKMVIDHLIPRAKGGNDSFENYVLTFADLNLGKSAKLDEKLIRMQWTVENIYAPRARKIFAGLITTKQSCNVEWSGNLDEPRAPLQLKNHPPKNYRVLLQRDVFWASDQRLTIVTNSDLVTKDNIHELLKRIESCRKCTSGDEGDHGMDTLFSHKYLKQIKSIWFNVDGKCFRLISDIHVPYEIMGENIYINFSESYVNFLKWKKSENEYFEKIQDLEDYEEYKILLNNFCEKHPPPEKYAKDILER